MKVLEGGFKSGGQVRDASSVGSTLERQQSLKSCWYGVVLVLCRWCKPLQHTAVLPSLSAAHPARRGSFQVTWKRGESVLGAGEGRDLRSLRLLCDSCTESTRKQLCECALLEVALQSGLALPVG